MDDQLYNAITQSRPDVVKVMGNSKAAVAKWWDQYGQKELANRLNTLGRQDVLNSGMNLSDWYKQYAPQEYKNIWKDTQKMSEAERLGIPEPAKIKQFGEVLPYETIFNPNLIAGLAESQLRPEINRQYNSAASDLVGSLSASGAFRTGLAGTQIRGLQDSAERQYKEQSQSFQDTINNMGRDWYNREAENYYKSPSTYSSVSGGDLPSFDDFMSSNPSLMNSYNNQTSVTDNIYKSPLLY